MTNALFRDDVAMPVPESKAVLYNMQQFKGLSADDQLREECFAKTNSKAGHRDLLWRLRRLDVAASGGRYA